MIKDKTVFSLSGNEKLHEREKKRGSYPVKMFRQHVDLRMEHKKRWYFHHPAGILNFDDESERTNSIKMFREFLSKLNKICLSVNTMDAMGIQASKTFPIRLCVFRKQRMELQTITMFLYFFLKEISICITGNSLLKKKKRKISIFLKRISLLKKKFF